MWEGISYIMKKLLLLIGILILTLGCSSEPEIIYKEIIVTQEPEIIYKEVIVEKEVIVTATPTYPLYTSGEARAKIIKYLKGNRAYGHTPDGKIIYCYRTEYSYNYKSDPDTFLTGTFTWNMHSYDYSNYAWTLQRNASPSASFHPNYKWTLYERTGTISSDHPDC